MWKQMDEFRDEPILVPHKEMFLFAPTFHNINERLDNCVSVLEQSLAKESLGGLKLKLAQYKALQSEVKNIQNWLDEYYAMELDFMAYSDFTSLHTLIFNHYYFIEENYSNKWVLGFKNSLNKKFVYTNEMALTGHYTQLLEEMFLPFQKSHVERYAK